MVKVYQLGRGRLGPLSLLLAPLILLLALPLLIVVVALSFVGLLLGGRSLVTLKSRSRGAEEMPTTETKSIKNEKIGDYSIRRDQADPNVIEVISQDH